MASAASALTYAITRDALVLHLHEDAAAHDAGRVDAIDIPHPDWPRLARLVASDLAGDREITDPRVLARFDVGANPSLGGRVQTLTARLRAG